METIQKVLDNTIILHIIRFFIQFNTRTHFQPNSETFFTWSIQQSNTFMIARLS